MENQQPEALALASIFEIRVKMFGEPLDNPPASRAAKELRRLHARNQELEAMLDAACADGVSAQRVTQAADHIERDRFEAWWRENVSQGLADIDHDYRYWAIWQARAALDADHIEQPIEMVAAQETNGLLARIEKEISTAQINNHRMAAPFGKIEGEPCVRISSLLATIEGFLNEATDEQAAAPVVLPEPDAWAAVYFSGKQAGKIYTTCDTKEQIEAYIHQVHQSNDSITLRAEPIYMRAAPQPQEAAQEPFGYFKAEPFGWRDCAETDEGAVALYEAPQPQAVPYFERIATKKLQELQDRGYTITGYSIEKSTDSGNVKRGFITHGGFVGWWQGHHTNQQPQADARAVEQPRLTVRLTSFPESNGKRNWTAMFVRAEPWDGLIGNAGGITIKHGELWNRVAYEAERARFLIGERDTEPYILDYIADIQTPDAWTGESLALSRQQRVIDMDGRLPPIPTRPCSNCGGLTNETYSIGGVMHMRCFQSASSAAACSILKKAEDDTQLSSQADKEQSK